MRLQFRELCTEEADVEARSMLAFTLSAARAAGLKHSGDDAAHQRAQGGAQRFALPLGRGGGQQRPGAAVPPDAADLPQRTGAPPVADRGFGGEAGRLVGGAFRGLSKNSALDGS